MPPLSAPESAAGPAATAFTRRDALRLMAAQMTAALAACGKPDEEILPYVRMPERIVPGEPLKFATTLEMGGYGRGVLGITVDGRPIKVEGNPLHPASLGSTDVFAEAAVLSLYDPDRSRTVIHDGEIASWDMFLTALRPELDRLRAEGGQGLRLLTGPIGSPTLARQIEELLTQWPGARWHAYDPVGEDAARAGATLAWGRDLALLPRLGDAQVVLALDADPLGPGPQQIRNARSWLARRDASDVEAFSRLYVLEAAPTLTGVKADERLTLHPRHTHNAVIALANALGAGLPTPDLPQPAARMIEAAARDLAARRGRALVLAGRTLSPDVHALVHWINATLAAPIDIIERPGGVPGREPAALKSLVDDLEAGQVGVLVVLGANPAYDAPPDLRFEQRLKRARFSVHLGTHADETAGVCRWHVPQSHPFECWSDLRAADGTASIVQPLISPLYGTRTAHEFLAAFSGKGDASAYDLVRQTWAATAGNDFEAWWRRVLHDGLIAGSAAKPAAVPEPRLPSIEPVAEAPDLTLVLAPDPCVWDGRFANNAWLQECPKPVTKEVWGNALGIGPDDAGRLGLRTGDKIEIAGRAGSLVAPVVVTPGHAPGVLSLTLGYGRTRAGTIGNHVGANAYRLRTDADRWVIEVAGLTKTGATQNVLATQNYVRLDGATRDLFPVLSLEQMAQGEAVDSKTGPFPSFFPPLPSQAHAWGMLIDTQACIGCNACVIACQAENNVPVVGPEEIAQGRDMHWLRVDIYDHGTPERPQAGFQPVPCMHCETAPCEPVCPVAASVHDHEGLNVQVYNRCVGTRFCEANCPYKVRRFNFFAYADGQEYGNLGAEPLKGQKNPDVTVRTRGVMEKCTYCVQRISRARRAGEREDRAVPDGEIVTACQAACPTRAITFGDLNQADSAVRRLKGGPRHYALLGGLGTRPRTTYLADLRNPNPARDGGSP